MCSPTIQHGRRRESGFTLIEVLIASVVGSVVVLLVATTVGKLGTGLSTSQARDKSRVMTQQFSDNLVSDLRAARARDRAGADAPSALVLRTALMDGRQQYSSTNRPLDLNDITSATSTSMTFQADVVTDPTSADTMPECVTYAVSGSAVWSIDRTVRAYSAGCAGGGGGVLTTDRLIGPIDTKRTGRERPGRVFAYRYLVRTGPTSCNRVTDRTTVTLTAAQRNAVMGVDVIGLGAGQAYGTSIAQTSSNASVAIGSRQDDGYRTALGCRR